MRLRLPTREQYLAAQRRAAERRAAVRTRDGVVDVAEWRAALAGAAALEARLRDYPWFAGVRAAVAPEVGCELIVTMRWMSLAGRVILPPYVDDVLRVRVDVLDPNAENGVRRW